ncbi:MAG: hypothetical protein MJ252_19580 [archaeon]|nr:hypothetical protein [archaeon]
MNKCPKHYSKKYMEERGMFDLFTSKFKQAEQNLQEGFLLSSYYKFAINDLKKRIRFDISVPSQLGNCYKETLIKILKDNESGLFFTEKNPFIQGQIKLMNVLFCMYHYYLAIQSKEEKGQSEGKETCICQCNKEKEKSNSKGKINHCCCCNAIIFSKTADDGSEDYPNVQSLFDYEQLPKIDYGEIKSMVQTASKISSKMSKVNNMKDIKSLTNSFLSTKDTSKDCETFPSSIKKDKNKEIKLNKENNFFKGQNNVFSQGNSGIFSDHKTNLFPTSNKVEISSTNFFTKEKKTEVSSTNFFSKEGKIQVPPQPCIFNKDDGIVNPFLKNQMGYNPFREKPIFMDHTQNPFLMYKKEEENKSLLVDDQMQKPSFLKENTPMIFSNKSREDSSKKNSEEKPKENKTENSENKDSKEDDTKNSTTTESASSKGSVADEAPTENNQNQSPKSEGTQNISTDKNNSAMNKNPFSSTNINYYQYFKDKSDKKDNKEKGEKFEYLTFYAKDEDDEEEEETFKEIPFNKTTNTETQNNTEKPKENKKEEKKENEKSSENTLSPKSQLYAKILKEISFIYNEVFKDSFNYSFYLEKMEQKPNYYLSNFNLAKEFTLEKIKDRIINYITKKGQKFSQYQVELPSCPSNIGEVMDYLYELQQYIVVLNETEQNEINRYALFKKYSFESKKEGCTDPTTQKIVDKVLNKCNIPPIIYWKLDPENIIQIADIERNSLKEKVKRLKRELRGEIAKSKQLQKKIEELTESKDKEINDLQIYLNSLQTEKDINKIKASYFDDFFKELEEKRKFIKRFKYKDICNNYIEYFCHLLDGNKAQEKLEEMEKIKEVSLTLKEKFKEVEEKYSIEETLIAIKKFRDSYYEMKKGFKEGKDPEEFAEEINEFFNEKTNEEEKEKEELKLNKDFKNKILGTLNKFKDLKSFVFNRNEHSPIKAGDVEKCFREE